MERSSESDADADDARVSFYNVRVGMTRLINKETEFAFTYIKIRTYKE